MCDRCGQALPAERGQCWCIVSSMSDEVVTRYVAKDFPYSSHRLLVAWVGVAPVRVLDLGAATGFLGAMLAARGHTVVGVERDAAAAAIARPHYSALYEADIERLGTIAEAPFAAIVVGDVLEHTVDPAAVLRRLVPLLEPDGRLLISLPNVAFIAVRLGLLVGRFEPARRGILDATHLHFYTRRSARHLVEGAGLRVARSRGVPPPLALIWDGFARWPWRVALELTNLAARVWPTLFAYQLVLDVRPPG